MYLFINRSGGKFVGCLQAIADQVFSEHSLEHGVFYAAPPDGVYMPDTLFQANGRNYQSCILSALKQIGQVYTITEVE